MSSLRSGLCRLLGCPEELQPAVQAWQLQVARKAPSGEDTRYTLFCLGPLSNWEPSPFQLDGHSFHSLEHYMMWRKAALFGDHKTAIRILACKGAAQAKALGREVDRFDRIRWYCEAKSVMHRGAYHGKFSQHHPSRRALLATEGTIIVEASNSDFVWGVGLAEYDQRVWKTAEWRGTNWAGEVLTRVREAILADGRRGTGPGPKA